MDPKLFLTVFTTVLLAELGDKTQLATLLFAARSERSGWTVFAGASAALVLTTALAVLAGAALSARLPQRTLSVLAGLGFLAVGAWTLARA